MPILFFSAKKKGNKIFSSELIHFLLLLSCSNLLAFILFLLLLFFNDLSFWFGNISAFNKLMKLFIKLFDTSRQKENVIVPFFNELVVCSTSFSFIAHIDNDKLIRFVLKSIQFRYHFVATNILSWVANGFLDSPEFILFWIS